jgi:uncharacterized DUF497 family protein
VTVSVDDIRAVKLSALPSHFTCVIYRKRIRGVRIVVIRDPPSNKGVSARAAVGLVATVIFIVATRFGNVALGIHRIYIVATRCEWNEKKNRPNRAKHGVMFQIAAQMFLDPDAVAIQDQDVDREQRWQTTGFAGAILIVASTLRGEEGDEVIRTISARKAKLAEPRIYEEGGQFD